LVKQPYASATGNCCKVRFVNATLSSGPHQIRDLAMTLSTHLIAETDELGHIAWMWRKGPTDRLAHPIAEPADHLHELGQSRLFGAPPEAISAWFARHVPKG
jgi:hypothetical protein